MSFFIEYEEILKDAIKDLGLTLEEVDLAIAAICSIANLHPIFFLWRPMLKDADDEFLVDLAFKAQHQKPLRHPQINCGCVVRFGRSHYRFAIAVICINSGGNAAPPSRFLIFCNLNTLPYAIAIS